MVKMSSDQVGLEKIIFKLSKNPEDMLLNLNVPNEDEHKCSVQDICYICYQHPLLLLLLIASEF